MNIENILSEVNRNDVEYSLGTSDFAQTISSPNNGLVDIQLMQRNKTYTECIIMGNQNISRGTKGIVLFVSKAKYPCFIPIYFVNDNFIQNKEGSISFKTQKNISENEYPQSEFINLRMYLSENGLSEGIQFQYRSNSPESEHWATKETVHSITNIIKDWFIITEGKSKIILGDMSIKTGGVFGPHKGRGHATGRAIDLYVSNGLEINRNINQNNKQELFNFFDICFNNGVLQIGWIAPNFLNSELQERYGNKIKRWDGHETHFHISFIIE